MNAPIVLAAALGLSFAATAATAQQAPQEEVYYNDLDLRSDAGVKSLDGRLDRAVRKVCGGLAPNNTTEGALIRACRSDTWASVMPARDEAIQFARAGTVRIVKLEIKPATRR